MSSKLDKGRIAVGQYPLPRNVAVDGKQQAVALSANGSTVIAKPGLRSRLGKLRDLGPGGQLDLGQERARRDVADDERQLARWGSDIATTQQQWIRPVCLLYTSRCV